MARPFLVAQLTDAHIGADWGAPGAAAALRGCVDALLGMPDRPDALVVTGDLTDAGTAEQYAVVREQLQRLGVPWHVLPGNHDDRGAMRAAFALGGEGADPIRYAADLGALRLVALDTTIPGDTAGRGRLDAEQLDWLADALARAPDAPTLLAMHHPPVLTGVRPWDATAPAAAEVAALAALLARHPQVLALAAGHLHRALHSELSGRPVCVVPSPYRQLRLDFEADDFVLAAEPPGFGIHALLHGRLVTHVQGM
ncbi:MAG: metallophosphoesterase [Solirubrobacterales bacterium]|nr:metallophosphoesterase [Solirubrobacterales bacterium]